MITFITLVHLLVAIVLIFLVLIQDSKGGAMGGMLGGGGGGSNSLLGATGAASFLVKLTRATAILFAATCIALTIMSSNSGKSVVDDFVPTGAATPQQDTAIPAGTETQKAPEGTTK